MIEGLDSETIGNRCGEAPWTVTSAVERHGQSHLQRGQTCSATSDITKRIFPVDDRSTAST